MVYTVKRLPRASLGVLFPVKRLPRASLGGLFPLKGDSREPPWVLFPLKEAPESLSSRLFPVIPVIKVLESLSSLLFPLLRLSGVSIASLSTRFTVGLYLSLPYIHPFHCWVLKAPLLGPVAVPRRPPLPVSLLASSSCSAHYQQFYKKVEV